MKYFGLISIGRAMDFESSSASGRYVLVYTFSRVVEFQGDYTYGISTDFFAGVNCQRPPELL